MRGAALGCLLVLLATVPAVLFASVQLPVLPGFTWAYVTVYALTGVITAALLQAAPEGWSWSLTLLTAGYVYSALATVPFLLTFPGAFRADGEPLMGGPSSAPWTFYLWQGGFLLFVLGSTALRKAELARVVPAERAAPAYGTALGIGGGAAVLLAVVVLAIGPALPDLLGPVAREQKTTTFHVLSWLVVVLGVVVLGLAVSVARHDGELRVWLVPVVLLTTVQAIQLPDGGRYRLGWYEPRVMGMIAATVLLVVLLVHVWRQTRELAAARALTDVQRRHTGYDPLTGLVNRENLLGALDGSTDEGCPLGVVMLNLNGMADINEAIGHRGGDEVLVEVRDRLLTATRPGDVLARYGGDVFAVVRQSPADDQEVQDLAAALSGSLDEAVHLGDVELVISASAGAVFCDDGRAYRDVVRLADAALKTARRQGRGVLHHRTVVPGAETVAPRLTTEIELRHALDEHRIFCLYQPVVVPQSRRVVGVEALARIRLADGGLLPPVLFIPLAAELGLLDRLTEQVLAQACDQAARWARAGTPLGVAINVAPSWVTRSNAVLVKNGLAQHGLPPTTLTLEITEDQAADLSDDALAVLQDLSDSGMGIAIDDFGTGYASLASFRDAPSTVLKIDRSFVGGMLRSQGNYDLVASMVELGHRFDKTIIAEGVETEDQLAALATLGCDLVQGYLTGRPMPAEEVPLGLRAVDGPHPGPSAR